MYALAIVLTSLAVLGAVLGLILLSQATTGTGILTGACLLGILARMAQAAYQHEQVMRVVHGQRLRAYEPRPDPWSR